MKNVLLLMMALWCITFSMMAQTKKMEQSGNKTKWIYRTAPDGYKWLPFEDEFGYLGVKDKNGKIIVPTFYNNIEYKDGFFIVKDKYGVYSIYLNTGELFLPVNNDIIVKFDTAIKNSPFIITSNKGTSRAMSRNGKILVAEDYYDFLEICETVGVQKKDDKDWVFRVGKYGYQAIVDNTGSVVIPFGKYNEIERHWTKDVGISYSFRIYGASPKSGICGKDGKEIITSDAYEIWVEADNNGVSRLSSYYKGYVVDSDLKGKTSINLSSLSPRDLKVGIELNSVKYDMILSPQNKIGIEKDGKNIVPAIYDKVYPAKKHFLVTDGLYYGAYDMTGKCIIPPNKYNLLGDLGTYFTAKIKNQYTSLDLNGKEFLPIGYGSASPHMIGKDTFLIVKSRENNKNAIYYKSHQLTDYVYRDVGFMTDNSGQCVAFFVYDDNHRMGLCRLDGKQIIEPMYSNIERVVNNGKNFYKVYNGKTIGLYDKDGKVFVTPELFDAISFSGKKIIATGVDRRCEFNLNGKLILDSHPNTERDNFIKMADKEFEQEDWGDAAKYYGKAIEYWESPSLYFNRAISYYNDSKFNKAIDDFNHCLSLKPNKDLIDRSRSLIAKARQLQAEKVARREAIWANVLGLVVSAAATYVQISTASRGSGSSSYVANSFKRDRSLDYLLDPNYTMQQVQMENWREYMTQTNGGRTMSYEQWYAIKAQSMSNSNYSEGSIGSSTSSTNSNSFPTQQTYSKDCRLCYGTGDCRTCEGRGYYFNSFNLSQRLSCPNCYNHNGKCSSCGGSGKK